MTTRLLVSTLTAVSLLAPAAGAQQDTTARVNFIFVLTPKHGMAKQLEDGFKKHLAWHAQQRDPRTIAVSTVAAGDGVGQYRVVYRNLRWEDQDRAAPTAAADIADVNVNLDPYLESTASLVSLRRDDLSRIPASQPAKAMSWVTYVYVKPGKATEYVNYLARLKEAHEKANSSYRYFILSVLHWRGHTGVRHRPAG
ncbi:MAG: hypothetical protein HY560_07555 [Gemmatimonadetes bacterium]|nr:hypothetical protein [Gemmatimonadota bacterium]